MVYYLTRYYILGSVYDILSPVSKKGGQAAIIFL